MSAPGKTPTAGPEAEYRALRSDAAALDLSGWTVLTLRGPDARTFLQGLASQDLSALRPGRAAGTLFLTERGRPVCLAWVAAAVDRAHPDAAAAAGAVPGGGPGEVFRVIADEGARDALRAHLERFRVMEEVEIEGPRGLPRLVGVAGPERDRILADAEGVIHGAEPIAAEPLSFLLVPADLPAVSLPSPAGPDAFEAWRLAVGLPRTGGDLDPERIATELSLPDWISPAKGCFVGQEVVARTSGRGQVRRRRFGFRFRWDGAPIPPGTALHTGGPPAGYVTSTAREPGGADGLGMGFLSIDALEGPGEIVAADGARAVRVHPEPWPL
jgi:folate-binding protein YgfZ